MKEVLILGAGISGLSAAWFLQKKAKIKIFEKSFRVGGLIRTYHKEGFLFEEGPRGFLSKGKGQKTLQLAYDLNLTKELICAKKQAKTRYLYHNGRLQPLNFLFLLKMNLLKPCFREWRLKSHSDLDESIGSFFSRRFNPQFVSTLIDPMVRGIFGGDPHKLSLQACFPIFHQWEKKYGSLTKGFFFSPKVPSILHSFQSGMEILPKTLSENIDAEIYLNTPVQKITLNDDKIVLHTETRDYEADHLIAAIPSRQLMVLLKPTPPSIPFLTLTTVHCGYCKPLLKRQGFGYLISSQQNEAILGMTWDSQIFPRNSQNTTLCVIMPGENPNAELIAKEALSRHLNLESEPDALHIHTAFHAIPQYPVGYKEELASFSHPRLTLLGHSYHGPGVNDCTAQASLISTLV